jgi:hypothetical protein
MTQRRWFLRILLVVIALIVIAEIGLRLVGFWYLANFYRELGTASRIQGSINIVCLGESTTAGLWVKFEDSYPKQLERVLRDFYRTNTINAIVPPHIGQNTSQMATDSSLPGTLPSAVAYRDGGSQQRVVPGRE